MIILFDAPCMKRALMHFADNVGPDQRTHLCSLIWAFSVRHYTAVPVDSVWTTKAQISLRISAG